MRITIRGIGITAFSLIVLLAGCGRDYEDFVWEFSTVLPCSVIQIVDNGFTSSDIVPFNDEEYLPGSFILVENPDMLDSLFRQYPPALDSLFPENGSLLLIEVFIPCGYSVLDHEITSSRDTVEVWLSIRHYEDSGIYIAVNSPACATILFPIGVVLQDSLTDTEM